MWYMETMISIWNHSQTVISESHYDIICIQVYITPWHHIWFPNHQDMISHMISQLCDITVWLWYHCQTMISHMMSCMYIMWCSSTSYVMSCVISHLCDIIGKHCGITCEIIGNKETHQIWYHIHFSYYMWYHIWHHNHVPCYITLWCHIRHCISVLGSSSRPAGSSCSRPEAQTPPDPSPPPPPVWAALAASGRTATALPLTNGPRAATTAALLHSHLNCCARGSSQRCQRGGRAHGMVQKTRPCAKQKWPR